nr:hypothetical protein BaRGS_019004 [Batillaria attramentaria]
MPGGGFASLLSIPANRKKMEVPEVYNSLVFDSGLPLAQHMNETAVTQHIAKLDRELDLMLVMEHFDESLVLLKRRACLQLKDIVHYKLNSRKSEPKHMITEADHQALRLWQMADHKTQIKSPFITG